MGIFDKVKDAASDAIDGVKGGAIAAIEDAQASRNEKELKEALLLVKAESLKAEECLCCGNSLKVNEPMSEEG